MPRDCIPPGDIMTVTEIAAHYRVDVRTVYKWFKRYQMPPDPIAIAGPPNAQIKIYDLMEVHLWLVDFGPAKFRDRGRA